MAGSITVIDHLDVVTSDSKSISFPNLMYISDQAAYGNNETSTNYSSVIAVDKEVNRIVIQPCITTVGTATVTSDPAITVTLQESVDGVNFFDSYAGASAIEVANNIPAAAATLTFAVDTEAFAVPKRSFLPFVRAKVYIAADSGDALTADAINGSFICLTKHIA